MDLSLYISCAALAISLGNAIASYIQKMEDTKRSSRKNLNDILHNLNLTYDKMEKFAMEDQSPDSIKSAQYRAFLNGQTRLYALEGLAMSKKITKMTNSADYLTMVRAFENNSLLEEEQYCRKAALKKAESLSIAVMTRRGLGMLKISTGENDEGRRILNLAIEDWYNYVERHQPERLDEAYWFDGETRERWSIREAHVGNFDEAREQIRLSEIAFLKLYYFPRRMNGLRKIPIALKIIEDLESDYIRDTPNSKDVESVKDSV